VFKHKGKEEKEEVFWIDYAESFFLLLEFFFVRIAAETKWNGKSEIYFI
jgi:hypothetical protein